MRGLRIVFGTILTCSIKFIPLGFVFMPEISPLSCLIAKNIKGTQFLFYFFIYDID